LVGQRVARSFPERWPAVLPCLGLNHSGLMPADLITLAHFSVSAATKLPKSEGEARNHCTAQVGEPCLKLGIGEGGVDLVVELVDDLGRRVMIRLGFPVGFTMMRSHRT
jgi:Lhr-like helicase